YFRGLKPPAPSAQAQREGPSWLDSGIKMGDLPSPNSLERISCTFSFFYLHFFFHQISKRSYSSLAHTCARYGVPHMKKLFFVALVAALLASAAPCAMAHNAFGAINPLSR